MNYYQIRYVKAKGGGLAEGGIRIRGGELYIQFRMVKDNLELFPPTYILIVLINFNKFESL